MFFWLKASRSACEDEKEEYKLSLIIIRWKNSSFLYNLNFEINCNYFAKAIGHCSQKTNCVTMVRKEKNDDHQRRARSSHRVVIRQTKDDTKQRHLGKEDYDQRAKCDSSRPWPLVSGLMMDGEWPTQPAVSVKVKKAKQKWNEWSEAETAAPNDETRNCLYKKLIKNEFDKIE